MKKKNVRLVLIKNTPRKGLSRLFGLDPERDLLLTRDVVSAEDPHPKEGEHSCWMREGKHGLLRLYALTDLIQTREDPGDLFGAVAEVANAR